MTLWTRHRKSNPRNCDACPPRHPAVWIFNRSPFPAEYFCVEHANREADAYGVDRPPALP
jgi:hypothetical protein